VRGMRRILIVCTGNICRSPMAEGLLKEMMPKNLKERIYISSAGTHAVDGNPATENAIQAVRDQGVDISSHRARELNRKLIESSDIILVMEKIHAKIIREYTGETGIIIPLAKFSVDSSIEEIEDPYEESMEVYLESVLKIRECLEGFLEALNKKSFE